MAKELFFYEKARGSLFKGINKVVDAVKATLGPKGRYVAIERYGNTEIINDGVTVAKSITLKDKKEEAGAKLIKEVASKTQDLAGDGTTTATVLTQAILSEGLKFINSGANSKDVRKGIEKATKEVIEFLRTKSRKIEDKKQIAQVATISANNDAEIGNLISEAMDRVGNNGIITVEEASSLETSVEVTQGMEFDKGYISSYMITDAEKKEVSFENPYILVTDYSISNLRDILQVLQLAGENSKPLLIIAEDLEGEALTGIVLNLLRETIKVAAVKAPGYGDERKELLKDIAALTGAKAILKDEKFELKNVGEAELGFAKKVKITKDKTTIIEGNGKDQLKERVELIKKQIGLTSNKSERESLTKRLASLTGGVAILKIGASTETEMKEKKHRVDDALNATRAAVEEGIIVGGGVALLRASQIIDPNKYEGDEKFGAIIVKRALEYPFRLILENGGLESSVIKEKVLENSNFNYGYNAKLDKYINLLEGGVIDPLKVTRTSLQNAASIASLILTTEVLIVEENENNGSEDNLDGLKM